MGITFDESTGIFHLRAGGASYVMRLTPERDVLHLHWGKALARASIGHICRPALRAFSPSTHPDNPDMSYDTLPLEYPFTAAATSGRPPSASASTTAPRWPSRSTAPIRYAPGSPASRAFPPPTRRATPRPPRSR